MRARSAVVGAALLCVACSAEEQDTRSDARDAGGSDTAAVVDTSSERDSMPRLAPEGWGPLRIGMTRAQITAAAGDDANPDAVGGPDPEACDQYRPTGAPEGMLLMVENDTLTRISLMRESRVRTDRGLGLGEDAAAVLAAYGTSAESSPHKYRDAPSAYITAWTTPPGGASPARGIVYEIHDDGRVALIHAGSESITYVEGCL